MTIKKQWFDMIASGEKKEEYRGLSDHWFSRLTEKDDEDTFIHYDNILLVNGYNKNSPWLLVECKGIAIREGKVKWGAEPGDEYFVLKLGKIIKRG